MIDDVERWLIESENDLDAAKILLDANKYNICAFHSQQSAEKALKALLILFQKNTWGHSIIDLLAQVEDVMDIPDLEDLEKCARELDKHYIPSRYPDAYPSGAPKDYYDIEIAECVLNCAKKIRKFVKETMQRYTIG
ncbi:MAG: HEPN domain-containing protein [Methanosarcinales archaeon]